MGILLNMHCTIETGGAILASGGQGGAVIVEYDPSLFPPVMIF